MQGPNNKHAFRAVVVATGLVGTHTDIDIITILVYLYNKQAENL